MGAKVHLPPLTADQYSLLIQIVKDWRDEAATIITGTHTTFIEKTEARKQHTATQELLDTIG